MLVALLALIATGCQTTSNSAVLPGPMTPVQLEPYACGTTGRVHVYDRVLLASQPSAEDFALARADGLQSVINLRHAREHEDVDERAVTTELGMSYDNLAWAGPDELTVEILDEARRLLRSAERPVMLHCSSANRVGAIWFAYRALDDGLGVEDAFAEAKTVGMRTPAYEPIVRAYIAERK